MEPVPGTKGGGCMQIITQGGWVIVQLALGGALAALARWARIEIRTRNPASRIWRFNRGSPVYIIVSDDDVTDTKEFVVKVYGSDYLAAVEARALITETLRIPDVEMVTSSEFGKGRLLHYNLVCVGGPVNNRITRLILERITIPVHFDGYTVVSDSSGSRYEATIDNATGKIIRDVGVAVLVKNPFEEKSSVVLLMGARTFGVAACSRALTTGSLRKMHTMLGVQFPKWAIIDVDVIDNFVARVEVLESSAGHSIVKA
jgi:hypothetical protein